VTAQLVKIKNLTPVPSFLHRLPWWCSPQGISVGFLLPVLFLIAYVGEIDHPGLTIRGIRFLSLSYIALGAGLLLLIGLGGWIGAQLRVAQVPRADESVWDGVAFVMGAIAVAAYLLWFRDYVFNPLLLWRTLTGEFRPDRDNIELTPGLTSLTNVAPVFFSIYAFRLCGPRGAPMHRHMHGLFVALVCFTAFRVYAWSERLALVETAVPFALAAGFWLAASESQGARWVRWLGPFAAIPGLIAYFGAAEYARSWTSDTYAGKLSFWDFAIGRFASYYYTSLNNGAGLLSSFEWPTYKFEHVLGWLTRAPLHIGPLFVDLIGENPVDFHAFLVRYADPEFNSPSGLFGVVFDLGIPMGIVYFFVVATAGGYFFRAFRESRLVGVLLYPMFFMSFLEVFRYPYLGTPRAFTWLLGIVVTLAWVNIRSRQQRVAAA
jgi:hypothetical protein